MSGSRLIQVSESIIEGLADTLGGLSDFNGQTRNEWNVSVTYGYDWSVQHAECVFLGRAQAQTPPAAMRAGRNFRDETGERDLIIRTSAVGGDQLAAEDRAFAIGVVVEEWVADRKNGPPVAGTQTLKITGWDLISAGSDSGHAAELTYRLQWTARLT